VEAAVTIAAHNAMTAYFPAAAPTLDGARHTDLAAIPNGPAKTAGIVQRDFLVG